MVVYVSPAEMNGGILQFSTSIARETRAFRKCKLFLPSVVDSKLFEDISEDVVTYEKVKTLKKSDKGVSDIAKQIIALSPTVVIFLEDSILMQQVNEILHKAGISTAIVIHDIQHHPYRNMGVRKIMVDIIRRVMTKKTIKMCTRIILLSKNSEMAFRNKYKNNNSVVFRLPAHIPNAQPTTPSELTDDFGDYFLFFGRIDEYKGINRLCLAYSALPTELKNTKKLVIAGKGTLSDEELGLIKADANIHLINRFIEDGEMIWLFNNSSAVIMPYIEASQSGVLPIAYKYGKPVIVSNLQGLTENVSAGKTGHVFDTVDELKDILCRFDKNDFSEKEILEFYQKNYSWKCNLEDLLDVFQTEVSE